MFSGICPTSKLYGKIIKMPSKSHETIPLKTLPQYRYLSKEDGLEGEF
jgi:hypothetical protein